MHTGGALDGGAIYCFFDLGMLQSTKLISNNTCHYILQILNSNMKNRHLNLKSGALPEHSFQFNISTSKIFKELEVLSLQ